MKFKSRQIKSNALLSAAIALTGVFISSNAAAFTDVPHTIATKLGHGLTYGKLIKQVEEAQKQLAEAKKHLAKLQGFKNADMDMSDKLELRDISYQMEIYCPGAGGGVVGAIQGFLTINANGKTKEEQKKICQNTVMARNTQYNTAVTLIKTLKIRNDEHTKIEERRKQVTSQGGEPGAMAAVDLDYQQLLGQVTMDTQYANSVITAYDAYIGTLQSTQAQLGKQALTGDSGNKTFVENMTTKFVQGAVLEGALQTARARDR